MALHTTRSQRLHDCSTLEHRLGEAACLRRFLERRVQSEIDHVASVRHQIGQLNAQASQLAARDYTPHMHSLLAEQQTATDRLAFWAEQWQQAKTQEEQLRMIDGMSGIAPAKVP